MGDAELLLARGGPAEGGSECQSHHVRISYETVVECPPATGNRSAGGYYGGEEDEQGIFGPNVWMWE